ncbi:hypothetical protein B9Z55_021530 [Caenorhabditis nigoni]|uniref:F-box domain-containing protein n=1 Tax=Caenorhabditis nigoni TaxID=1611254 RepID=A0A2G5TSI2_9PELO|nr:hypothetical protein B9Z55_021530 [Caenorhabditis nigoni]
MPIRILFLPGKDLQYALNCMDIGDFIAFSLCSKRTRNLAKSSNRKIDSIIADVYQNFTCIEIRPSKVQRFQSDPNALFIYLHFSNPWIQLDRKNGIEVWRKQEFTQSDWIAHILSIFKGSVIEKLGISDVCPVSYLDNVQKIIPKCNKLEISEKCSAELTKRRF